MKKYIGILLLTLAMIGTGTAKIKVVTSLPDLADFTRIVGGDKVDVDNIVRGSQNPHFIEVKPSYMIKLRSADLFIMIGMQLEMWAPQIIDGSRNTRLTVIDCSKNIDKLEVPTVRADASYGDVHPFGNPHYWLDPENVKPIMQEIVDGLAKISPSDYDYFKANMDGYVKKLDGKVGEWKKLMEPLKNAKIVTYHTSFSYLAHRFGLQVAGYVEPKPGIPPSPSHSAELIQLMRNSRITTIALEQFYEENSPRQIAEATGASVVKLSTSVGGLDGTDSYINLIDYDLHALSAALKKK